MFKKILVANRGEIAIRAFRAAHELGATTVAVFPYEDRGSLHRLKADEAYLIGEVGHPVKAYLNVAEIVRVAKESGADAIYPGYGFLSENPELAHAAKENNITFIGPDEKALKMAGDKVQAKQYAKQAGIPVLKSTQPSTNIQQLSKEATEIGYPVFVKAVAGGGGRGMRLVETPDKLENSLREAMNEAQTAFGNANVFIEQAVTKPRHIEVQILADKTGNTVHLYERDCSVQRRHQKVVEIAPAPHLDEKLRARLTRDAIRFARSINYVNAGTVEFLLDTAGEKAGQHVFIEMNPRIQVEHTVTEEVTDIDLVQAQLRIAAGETLEQIGLTQNRIHLRGHALQCRITTEDPQNDFRPDLGRITAYRSPGGGGVRLDGGTISAGAQISPHFDSMLAKLTCRGQDFQKALTTAKRALAEFRIRGVATNIPFLQAVLNNEDFKDGKLSTTFIQERPQLLNLVKSRDRATRLLQYLAEVTVNTPNGPRPHLANPASKLPALPATAATSAGNKNKIKKLGPAAFAKNLRNQQAVAITDTTFRDAHQSLLATRIRSKDLLQVAPHVAHLTPQLLSVEAWGGASYDVALRFLGEDPWERLAGLNERLGDVPLQMLLRGQNTVGYTPYPPAVARGFIAEAAACGTDIFRIFDALNDTSQMQVAIDAVLETGTAIAEVAMCYTGNLLDPGEKKYDLDYYLHLAEQIVASGAHVLAIKDMAGLLRPAAAKRLVTALRDRFDLPVHLHTHDTAGGQLATLLAAIAAGVDAVDAAHAPMAGTTSQPSLSALVAALANTPRASELNEDAVYALEPYWEAVRALYAPFESGLTAPTGRVYRHEIPGGQLSNLRQQAIALGLQDDFEKIEDMYAAADRILGRIPKVTPSSKVVGDLALHLAAVDADPQDFAENPENYDVPDSVIGFLQGELGELPGGWPEPFRTKVLQGRENSRQSVQLNAEDKLTLQKAGPLRRATLNRLLFPGPNKQFLGCRESYGDVSVLDTVDYLYGLTQGDDHAIDLAPGVRLYVGLEAIGEADDKGVRTVMVRSNGQLRQVYVKDESARVSAPAVEKADRTVPGQLAAPFAGTVTIRAQQGDTVAAGEQLASIEAMKMEAAITAPITGKIVRLAFTGARAVEAGDLLLVIE